MPDQLLVVSVPGASRARAGVARILRDDSPREVGTVAGLRVVAPVDALLDTLVCTTDDRARALLDHALQRHWVTAGEFESAVRERVGRGRLGAARLRALARRVADNAHSEGERLVVGILQEGGVAGWVANWVLRAEDGTPVAELDVAFPDLRICIEVDGFAAHSGREQFEHDRARQNQLVLDGWLILRFTWRQLVHERSWVLQQIRTALASRASQPV